MILIPPEVRIGATLRPGAVFYFAEEMHTGETPHFFVVLNHSPKTDEVLLLIHSSSQVEKVRRRTRFLPGTLVEVTPAEYPEFTAPVSAFDGNNVTVKRVAEIVAKLAQGKLRQRAEMPASVTERLRQAVLASPTVERKYKKMLLPSKE